MNQHVKRKFKTAYKNCEQLKLVSEACLEGFSKLEMDAYIKSIQAAYLMEVRQW